MATKTSSIVTAPQRTVVRQRNLFFEDNEISKKDTSSTFIDNLSLPIHKWFRFSAGFSAQWVRSIIEKEKENGWHRVFDPFAGSGTVLLEGEFCGIDAAGVEAHPFIARIAQAKLFWKENPRLFQEYALTILRNASKHKWKIHEYPELIHKCFPTEVLSHLDSLRQTWAETADGSSLSELTWLVLTSILRECSPVGTAQWQYILPNKSKAKFVDPYKAFENKVFMMSYDMSTRQRQIHKKTALLHRDDARQCASISNGWADIVITSPPYSNNYDYADAMRFEMSFFGEITGWGDLQDTVRVHLIRSCTQHVAKAMEKTYEILDDLILAPIKSEITETCKRLEKERLKHGGRKPYHTMIAAYFHDMAKVWIALRRVTHRNSLVCFVIGDSAPYGIYVPVDRWFGELALAAGFKSYHFEKTRDRNIKWKNRKHRVPLHEGRLWVQG